MSGKPVARWLVAPLAFVAVALVLSRFQPAAEAGGRTPPPKPGTCAGTAPLGRPISAAARAAGHGSWWRLTDAMDANGELVGRTLTAGHAAKTTLSLPLGTESMARGPVGGLLIVTNDDGRSSEVRLVSIADGCSWLVHRDVNVVRSAIFDAAAGVGYAHLVERDTRTDLGVFRIAAGDVEAPLDLAVAPLAPQPDLGPVWATELRLDADGTELAVQSCSDRGCRTRVVSLHAPGSPMAQLRGDDQGSIIGFAGGRIITWSFCSGLPCGVQSWVTSAAAPAILADHAVGAGITRDGRYLVVVTDDAGRTVRLDIATNAATVLRGVAAGELPLGSNVAATLGLEVADDEVALAGAGADPRAFSPGAAAAIP